MSVTRLLKEALVRAVVVLLLGGVALALAGEAQAAPLGLKNWADGRNYVHYLTTKHKLG